MALYGAPSRHYLRRAEQMDGDYEFTRRVAIAEGAETSGFPNGPDALVLQPPTYEVASVPDATAHTGAVIFVTDGAAGGPCLALSDGTNWLVAVATSGGTPISGGV